MKQINVICDIENCKGFVGEPGENMKLQVIFHTEQTEGRATNPYLYLVEVDICEACKNRILTGDYVHAWGAQGYNKYNFKD